MDWKTIRPPAGNIWRFVTFGAIDQDSLSGFLKSPIPALILLAVSSVIPFPWDAQFGDARVWNIVTFTDAGLLLLLLIALRFTVPQATSVAGGAKRMPPGLRVLAGATIVTSLLLVGLLGHARFLRRSFVVKWPTEVSTPDVVIGGTFSHVNFAKERLGFYVCTEVPDRSRATQPQQWHWRCWLDQHPPDVEFHSGVWQATCRFGNEEGPENDRANPVFQVVPVVTQSKGTAKGLPGVIDASPEDLREQLQAREDVACVGPPFRVQRWTRSLLLPAFKRIRDSSQSLDFSHPAAIRYSICPDAVITWEPASGATSEPSYEVFFDGLSVARGDGTALNVASLLEEGQRRKVIDLDQWRMKARMELKISHDPMIQHYRNMYLYLSSPDRCKGRP
jgi:hypothetical protein